MRQTKENISKWRTLGSPNMHPPMSSSGLLWANDDDCAHYLKWILHLLKLLLQCCFFRVYTLLRRLYPIVRRRNIDPYKGDTTKNLEPL